MNTAIAGRLGPIFSGPSDSADQKQLFLALFGILILFGALAGALFMRDKYMYSAMVLAIPLALVIVCSPRLALYQFIAVLFLHRVLAPGLTLVDLSATVLMGAAILDTLTRARPSAKASSARPLAYHYLAILVAVGIAGIFAFDPSLSIRQFLRIIFILVSFLSLIRLLKYVQPLEALKFYFWMAVVHSLLALGPFIAAKGAIRTFGFTGRALDELTMLALPLGLAFFLGAKKNRRSLYAMGLVVTFGGLVATQSRAPIIFAVFGIAFTFWAARQFMAQAPTMGNLHQTVATQIQKHIRNILLVSFAFALVILLFSPDVLSAALTRFERLLTFNPGGTFRLRLTLWGSALLAFSNNPLVGIGPGNFKFLGNIYSTLHLDAAHLWIRGLSAHNLLLQYLAETGIIGGSTILALFWRQFSMARRSWRNVLRQEHLSERLTISLGLYSVGALFLLSTLLEAGWMWSQTGFIAAFFLAVISQNFVDTNESVGAQA